MKVDFVPPTPSPLMCLGETGKPLSAPLKISILCTQGTCAQEHFSVFGPSVVSCGSKERREKCPINFKSFSQCFSVLQFDLKSFLQRVLLTARRDAFPLPVITAEWVL